MNNWEKTTLGEIINFVNGYAFKSRDFLTEKIEGAMPIIKIRNVASGSVIFDGVNYHIYSDIYIKYTIKKGNILIAMTGNHPEAKSQVVGEVALYKDEELSLMNQRVGKILPKDGKVNNNFLYYFLKNDITHYKIAEKSAGSANQANISGSDIESLEINLPPLDEQKRIADVLSALDDKIEINNKINENLEAQAQAIFKRWFVDFEFPDEEGKPYKSNGGKFIDSELGEIPLGWKVGTLGEFIRFIKGKKPKYIVEEKLEGYELYLTIDALTSSNSTYSETEKNVLVNELDLLMVMDGASSGTMYFGKKGIVGSTLSKIELFDNDYKEIIYRCLKYYESEIKAHTTGSAIPHTDKNYVLQLPFIYPLIIMPYCDIFIKIREQQIINQKENQNLSELRDSLLPKLMSGEVRV